jgi:hypothetical protein
MAVPLSVRALRLNQVAKERGIGFMVAATFPGERGFERTLKNRKNTPP